jgi:hypothetical protein
VRRQRLAVNQHGDAFDGTPPVCLFIVFSCLSPYFSYAPYVEHVPPDVTACIYWMKNRDPAH